MNKYIDVYIYVYPERVNIYMYVVYIYYIYICNIYIYRERERDRERQRERERPRLHGQRRSRYGKTVSTHWGPKKSGELWGWMLRTNHPDMTPWQFIDLLAADERHMATVAGVF